MRVRMKEGGRAPAGSPCRRNFNGWTSNYRARATCGRQLPDSIISLMVSITRGGLAGDSGRGSTIFPPLTGSFSPGNLILSLILHSKYDNVAFLKWIGFKSLHRLSHVFLLFLIPFLHNFFPFCFYLLVPFLIVLTSLFSVTKYTSKTRTIYSQTLPHPPPSLAHTPTTTNVKLTRNSPPPNNLRHVSKKGSQYRGE